MKSMRSVKYRNALFLKGVLIVILPCLVNSAFIFYLNKHWQKTAQAALATEKRLYVMLTLNDAFESFLTFGYDVLTNTFRETRASQHGNEILSSDRAIGLKNQALPSEAKKILDAFTEIRQDIDHLLENVESVKFHDGRSRFNTFAFILKKACASGTSFDVMLQEQSQRSDAEALEDAKLSADARLLLLTAVLVEIALSFLLFLLFALNIVRRLRILAGNAACLNQWSEQPALGGADELSYLDSVFKEAGARIKAIERKSDEQKKNIAKVMKAPAAATNAYFADVQENKMSLSPEQRHAFDQWMQSAGCALSRLQSSTANLVSARVDKSDFSPVDLGEVVELCIRELAPLAGLRQVILVNNCEHATISARRDKLILVIMKYLVNALKNAPDVTEIQINQVQRDNWLNFSVRDSGKALSASMQKQVFNDGTNGLYVCKSIIENEGGKFGAKTLGASGNEFWFALPVVPRKAKTAFSLDELMGVGADPRYRQEKFIFQSGLFRKAALIVFVPLVLHLILFLWMGQQLGVLEQMIEKGHREESLTLNVSSLWLNSFLANSSAAIFLTGRDKKYYTSAVEHVNRVDQCVSQLKNHGGLAEQQLLLVRKTSDFAASQSDLVKQGMVDDSEVGINKTLKIMPSMFNRSAQLSDELNHLMSVESNKTHVATREQVELQSLMEKLVYCAVFLNFFIAFFFIRFFILNFNNRINGLVVEAGMVADGQPLPVSTDWADEVNQIQGFLALASKSVEVRNEAQTAALTLLALEVSSPLETLDSLFKIIESVPESEVGWSRELCANVRSSLESAFEQVDQLLVPL
jgi:signal transduction histidine kinase